MQSLEIKKKKKIESLGTKNDLLWKFRDKNDILPYLNGTLFIIFFKKIKINIINLGNILIIQGVHIVP